MHMVLQDEDQLTSKKTLYDAKYSEIIWRNFLAGVSRAFGGIVLYIVFFVVVGNLFMTYVWPRMEPVVSQLQSFSATMRQINRLDPNSNSQLR